MYFLTPFTKLGMAAEGASSFSFPAIMGHLKAAAILLVGDGISADDAERLGLVSKILPTHEFLGNVLDIATRLASSLHGALQATKALMRNRSRQELLDANDRECALIQNERFGSEENLKAVSQFRRDQELRKKHRVRL
ncbi:ClpP/crotonase [Bimuria novae-zelandiae CBS 107.79]|uniref:ClpP/crotonase n=1 Tax=Bimuria novae-zelandiae CBS 107.79 TaxID=1447943 RepID=A0A6A5UNZ0_9PLEO|nr:ClpP/crotonase [Bimuria novae-zelandiae CBS 107.79]